MGIHHFIEMLKSYLLQNFYFFQFEKKRNEIHEVEHILGKKIHPVSYCGFFFEQWRSAESWNCVDVELSIMGSNQFRSYVWDPVMILGQILAIQCIFYFSLGIWISLSDLIIDSPRSLEQIFSSNVSYGGRVSCPSFSLFGFPCLFFHLWISHLVFLSIFLSFFLSVSKHFNEWKSWKCLN